MVELKGTHLLQVYADNSDLLGKNEATEKAQELY
jgi:hypothetical protein